MDPKISLVSLDDDESSLKRREWCAGDLNLGGRSSFGRFPNLEEDEWKVGWWISTFELRQDGLIEDSNDDLKRFPNVVLIDSSFDEARCLRLESWTECFEGKLDYSKVSSLEVLYYKEYEKLLLVAIEVFLSTNESSEGLKSDFKDKDSEDELVQSENEALKEFFEVED